MEGVPRSRWNFPAALALGSCLMRPHTPRPQLRGGWGGLPSSTHTLPHSMANEWKRPRRSQTLSRADSWMFYHLSHSRRRDVFLGAPANKSFEPPGRARSASKSESIKISSLVASKQATPMTADGWGDDWKERRKRRWKIHYCLLQKCLKPF